MHCFFWMLCNFRVWHHLELAEQQCKLISLTNYVSKLTHGNMDMEINSSPSIKQNELLLIRIVSHANVQFM